MQGGQQSSSDAVHWLVRRLRCDLHAYGWRLCPMFATHHMPYSELLPPTLPPQTAAWSAGQCWQLPHLHIAREGRHAFMRQRDRVCVCVWL